MSAVLNRAHVASGNTSGERVALPLICGLEVWHDVGEISIIVPVIGSIPFLIPEYRMSRL